MLKAKKGGSFFSQSLKFGMTHVLGLADISEEDKDQFRQKLEDDTKFSEEVSLKLMLIFEKFDDIEKSKLLGKAFVSYIKGSIDYPTFLDLSIAINLIKVHRLQRIRKALIRGYVSGYSEELYEIRLSDEDYQEIESAGLLKSVTKIVNDTNSGRDGFDSDRLGFKNNVTYAATRLGQIFDLIVLENHDIYTEAMLKHQMDNKVD